MNLTKQEEETLKAYNENAAAWSNSRNIKGYWAKEKEKLYNYLPYGKLLEVGSGGGRDATDFIEKGYEYIGTDISQGLLEEARKNNPGVTFLKQSLYELDFPENTFDGIWACATLLHIPKERIDEALQSLRKVAKNGAIIGITLKKGDGERFVDGDHVGIKYNRFFSFYQKEEFNEVLKRNTFEVLEGYETKHSDKPWLVFFAKVIK